MGLQPSALAHTYNPHTLGGWGRWIGELPEVRSLRPAWPIQWNSISTKNMKIGRIWWWVPVIPASQEAETGELLEPRRRRLQWAEIVPLHSSLGDRARLCLKKEKNNKENMLRGRLVQGLGDPRWENHFHLQRQRKLQRGRGSGAPPL